jgi:hypothetical protein
METLKTWDEMSTAPGNACRSSGKSNTGIGTPQAPRCRQAVLHPCCDWNEERGSAAEKSAGISALLRFCVGASWPHLPLAGLSLRAVPVAGNKSTPGDLSRIPVPGCLRACFLPQPPSASVAPCVVLSSTPSNWMLKLTHRRCPADTKVNANNAAEARTIGPCHNSSIAQNSPRLQLDEECD